jgi:hypothetical protein
MDGRNVLLRRGGEQPVGEDGIRPARAVVSAERRSDHGAPLPRRIPDQAGDGVGRPVEESADFRLVDHAARTHLDPRRHDARRSGTTVLHSPTGPRAPAEAGLLRGFCCLARAS